MFNTLSDVEGGSRDFDSFDQDVDIENSHDGRRKRRRCDPNSKGSDMMDFEPLSDSSWVRKSDQTKDFPLAPSVKTGKLKAVLLKSFHESPGDKVSTFWLCNQGVADIFRLSFMFSS